MMTSHPVTITSYQLDMAPALIELWNRATVDRHPIPPELWRYCTEGDPYFRPEDGLVAAERDRLLGFLLAKRYRGTDPGCREFLQVGWIALMAVDRELQHRGIGGRLLKEAEKRLEESGVSRIEVGGSFFHFTPGLPQSLSSSRTFFYRFGYNTRGTCWDVRRDLRDFRIPLSLKAAAAAVHPFRKGQEEEMLALMRGNDFPARWAHDAEWFIRGKGDIASFIGLWHGRKAVGFSWIHPPGSVETLCWQGFDPAIAALGPIGVIPAERGKGLGLTLLAGALERLRDLGTRNTVVDWTSLLGFYRRLEFLPWIRYERLSKPL